ncbi:MAG: hypothetical protein IJ307_02740 [Bacteroidales bacterium]|nr:hypothetical protein [Bacteroidales bacterium]
MRNKRILISVIGVVITAISVGAFKFAAFGVDPFQSFMSGIDSLFPLDFGTLYVIVNAVLLLFALVFDRHYIGISTFINLFLLGYIVDFSQSMLECIFPDASAIVRVIAFALGFLSLCLGSSLYMTADLGVSTYDVIALVCTNKWHMGKFKYVRICTDIVCIILGIGMYLFSGGPASHITTFIGIGTILTAMCMGPLIDFFNRKISTPILKQAEAQI